MGSRFEPGGGTLELEGRPLLAARPSSSLQSGDKTELAVVTLAAKRRDLPLFFVGAAVALLLLTAPDAAGGGFQGGRGHIE